jgi:hypothetical protein
VEGCCGGERNQLRWGESLEKREQVSYGGSVTVVLGVLDEYSSSSSKTLNFDLKIWEREKERCF